MPKLTDYVSAAEAFQVFEEEFEGTLVPIASNSFEGAGIHDEELAVSRPAKPLDLQSIAPPSSWENFGNTILQILGGIELQDVLLMDREWWARKIVGTAAGSPLVFAEQAGLAYSNYIKVQFEGYIELMKFAIPTLLDLQQCEFHILEYSVTELIDLLLSDDGKAKLEQAKADLIQHVIADEKCKVLIGIVDAMISLHEAWIWLKETPHSQIWEEIGHVAYILAELLRRAEIQKTLISIAEDPIKLGGLYGTLVGVVIWEVIEEVATAGLSKGLRFLKVVI